jgi:radical SAM superfamily enzyme YgiQ (UPF0313 family)
MRITLIEPSRYSADGRLLRWRQLILPPITLPLLAALTPKDFGVKIVNEFFEDIDFGESTDIVGITAYSSRVLRAYEIADEFRRRGVYVVMGGIHVTMEPEEALLHADTVIMGEAEERWPRFLTDFKSGSPLKIYRNDSFPSLDHLPVPRFSLLKQDRYLVLHHKGLSRFLPTPLIPVQTARGCAHNCDYCSVSSFSGHHYRTRPIEDVVAEVKSLEARGCLFIDDNIFADFARSKALFRALIPLKITWLGQGTLLAAEDPELLGLAAESGCIGILVGLESISPKTLKGVGKSFNIVEKYPYYFKKFRESGISLLASMIFGLDGETPTVFEETHSFLMKNKIPYTLWQPLMPLPGTRLYERFRTEGRLKMDKWWLNRELSADFLNLKFKVLAVPEERFRVMFSEAYKRFYYLKNIFLRILWPLQKRSLAKVTLNLIFRRRIFARASITES